MSLAKAILTGTLNCYNVSTSEGGKGILTFVENTQ